MQVYGYLALISQLQARPGIVGNSTSAVDSEQVFKTMFNALINKDFSISVDIDRC